MPLSLRQEVITAGVDILRWATHKDTGLASLIPIPGSAVTPARLAAGKYLTLLCYHPPDP